MKKAYFKVVARFYEKTGIIGDNAYYECYCYNDGYVILENGKLKGYLSLDFLLGTFSDNELTIELQIYDDSSKHLFSNSIDSFELPNSFTLYSNNMAIELSFEGIIKDKEKQNEISSEIENICRF
ncbi:MAG: hypothetical protein HFJ35_01075 [Clostridia bacterium]|nr:hypothetical protein [Clostridia bacterium]